MLIAWQTVSAVWNPESKMLTRGFLICAPWLTIRERLRVLQSNNPGAYYAQRELGPADILPDVQRAEIVITSYHAFPRRERMDISKGVFCNSVE